MAKTLFKRIEDSAFIDNLEIEDGSFIVTGDGKTFVDYGENRIATSGTPDTQMSGTSVNTVQNKTIKNYVDNSIQSTYGTILWTNPNPSSDFTNQTIMLSSDDYDLLEFYFIGNVNATTNKKFFTEKAVKGTGVLATWIVDINEGIQQYTGFRQRPIDYVSDISYNVGKGLQKQGGNSIPAVANNYMVPLYVIGYKTNLF